MKKLDWLLVGLLCLGYLIILFFKYPQVYSYRFDPQIIDRYLRSQDIYGEVYKRDYISDSDIYTASGYLYLMGNEPTKYNFQHPPLVKYLFGFSTWLFFSPYVVQIFFGFGLISLTYFLGKKAVKMRVAGVMAAFLLVIDPAFLSTSSEALLDMGQAVLALGYFITMLFSPANFLLQGLILGLFAASKFWTTSVFFVVFLWGIRIIQKKSIEWATLIKSLLIAAIVFASAYSVSFFRQGITFNLPFLQLKMLKFMLQHNASSIVGAPLIQFITGYYKEWWSNGVVTRTDVWTFLWPITFITSLIGLVKFRRTKMQIIFLLPIVYLFFLGAQVPFPRYFLIVLPYFYVGLSWLISSLLKRFKAVN